MRRPMEGVRVLEVAQFTFVPAAGAVLAEWGADVIKVEHAETGDVQRGLSQAIDMPVGSGAFVPLMEHANRGKRSIGLSLEKPEALRVPRRRLALSMLQPGRPVQPPLPRLRLPAQRMPPDHGDRGERRLSGPGSGVAKGRPPDLAGVIADRLGDELERAGQLVGDKPLAEVGAQLILGDAALGLDDRVQAAARVLVGQAHHGAGPDLRVLLERGLYGERVGRPEEIGAAMARARSSGGPALLDLAIAPEVVHPMMAQMLQQMPEGHTRVPYYETIPPGEA